MIWIEGDGFIDRKHLNQSPHFYSLDGELFSILLDLNEFSESLKKEFVVFRHETDEEKQKVISMIVFIRLLEIVQAFAILAGNGIREELHSLFRIFLDAYFVLANCCSDPDFIPIYFRSDENNRLKLMNVSLKYDSALFNSLKAYAEKERDALEEKIKEENIQRFNSYEYAKKAGCEQIYDSMYRLSSASIHTTPRCIDHYFESDSKGNIFLIKHESNPEEINECIYDVTNYFIKAISGISQLFSIDNQEKIESFERRIRDIPHKRD